MHIPDGFINGATSAAAGVAAAGGVTVAVRRARDSLGERQVPLAGLTAAFVFAAQMVNFPVVPGMSGHLLGGVLAAVLVGPWAGLLVVTVVLTVQAVLIADGGLSALGLGIVNMGLIGTLLGYLVYRLVLGLLPRSASSVTIAAGIAAFVSLPLAAMGFVVEYAIGGTPSAPVAAVFAAMLGTHLLIGIGEGFLTALVVGAVMATRPDLVHGNPGHTGTRTRVLV